MAPRRLESPEETTEGPTSLELRRSTVSLTLGALAGLFFLGVGLWALFVRGLNTSTNAIGILASIALGSGALIGTANNTRPRALDVDERGFHAMRGGRTSLEVPWDSVSWVASGRWGANPYTWMQWPTPQSFMVMGSGIRQTISVNDFTYRLTEGNLARFTESALRLARSHSVPVLSKPAFYRDSRTLSDV